MQEATLTMLKDMVVRMLLIDEWLGVRGGLYGTRAGALTPVWSVAVSVRGLRVGVLEGARGGGSAFESMKGGS